MVASPKTCLTPEEAKIAGKYFDQYIWNDRIVYKRPKPIPFYQKLPSWEKYLRGSAYLRNQKKVNSFCSYCKFSIKFSFIEFT